MTDDPISRVAIIVTGQMGPTIAIAATLAGCPTTLIGRTTEFKALKQERRGTPLGPTALLSAGLAMGCMEWLTSGFTRRREAGKTPRPYP